MRSHARKSVGGPAMTDRRSFANHSGLQLSSADRVSALLIAFLVMLTATVSAMGLLWWFQRTSSPPLAVNVLKFGHPNGDGKEGDGGNQGIGDSGPLQMEEPTETSPTASPEVAEGTLSLIASSLTVPEVAEQLTSEFGPSRGARGPGKSGNISGTGPRGDAPGAAERWEIQLSATTMQEYAAQLDALKIELGIVGGGDSEVTYVSRMNQVRPEVRKGLPEDEHRLRFLHRSGQLREADRRLVQKAGVDPAGKVVFQFYSNEICDQLLKLEHAAQGERPLSAVRRTTFGVRQAPGKYEFFVLSQEYR